jgi:hypothetical protein
MAAVDIRTLDADASPRIVLRPEAEVRGVVRDEASNPIASAAVKVIGFTHSKNTVDRFLSEPGDIDLSQSEIEPKVFTDQNGNFVIKNLPTNCNAILDIEAAGYVTERLGVDTNARSNDTKRQQAKPLKLINQNDVGFAIHGSPVDVKMSRAHVLTVRVLNHDGTSVDRGSVLLLNSGANRAGIDAKSGQTILSVPKPGEYRLRYVYDPVAGGFGAALKVTVTPDDRDQKVEIRFPESRWVTGRVICVETGQPVVGARISGGLAVQGNDEQQVYSGATSRENGKFRIPAVIGENRIRAVHSNLYGFASEPNDVPAEFAAGVTLSVNAEGELPEVVLKMTAGISISGIVLNTQGDPVSDCAILVEQLDERFFSTAVRTDQKGRFRAAGLPSGARVLVTAIAGANADRTIVDCPKGQQREPIPEVRLTVGPGIQLSGRVMRRGKPVPGVIMELSRSLPGRPNTYAEFVSVTTDS